MEKIDYFITFLIIVKILFVVSALTDVYLEHNKGSKNEELIEKVQYWKDRFEFIFIAGMSLLLLYFFFPRNNKPIVTTFETRFLFFAYGIIIFIKMDWGLFINESKLFDLIQRII